MITNKDSEFYKSNFNNYFGYIGSILLFIAAISPFFSEYIFKPFSLIDFPPAWNEQNYKGYLLMFFSIASFYATYIKKYHLLLVTAVASIFFCFPFKHLSMINAFAKDDFEAPAAIFRLGLGGYSFVIAVLLLLAPTLVTAIMVIRNQK